MKNIKIKIKKLKKNIVFLIKKTLLKHREKTNNIFPTQIKFKIGNLNKFLIFIISFLFLYLFYLSIPTLYDKTWVQKTIENKLLDEFKINFSISSDISYEILPSPHFTVKNAKIYKDQESQNELSEIKKLKIFINQKKFFNKKNIEIKKVIISEANFLIYENDILFFSEFIKDNISKKKIFIKDSNLFFRNSVDKKLKSIAEIKNLRIFLNQKNFFDKEKVIFKKIVINDTNFSLNISDFKVLNKNKNINFSNKKIHINNSNVFFKDNIGDVISIIKIKNGILFFDEKKLLNLFSLKGEVFNLPFTFDFKNYNNLIKDKEITLNFKSLKLNILNKSTQKKDDPIIGENVLTLLNSKIHTKYEVKEKLIIFESNDSNIYNSQVNYKGELSINPFDLNLIINLANNEISKLFNINPILAEFIKSDLLFNENINIDTSMIVNSKSKKEIFHNAKLNFKINRGKINFNNTRFVNNEIGSLELINSNLFLRNGNLVFNGSILIDIKSSDKLFSFLNTSKSSRKKIKNILINLDYDFLTNQFTFHSIKIDNNDVNEQLLNIIEDFNGNNLNNFNKSRRLINEIIKTYEG
jgi:hypothetical protein